MKKILIVVGTLLILIMLGVWGYLFLYGTPENLNDVFAKFKREENEPVFTETSTNTSNTDTSTPSQTKPKALRQLTLRPVAGAGFANNMVRFIEQGTGHVYDISPTGEGETIVSGTTIPQTIEAQVSPNGMYVAITKLSGNARETVVGQLNREAGTLTGNTLPEDAKEVAFTEESDHIRYVISTDDGSVGYDLDLKDDAAKSTVLFSIPLRDIRVHWGEPTYVATTPTFAQIGYVYRLNKNSLEYVTEGGRGLMAIPYYSGLIVSRYTMMSNGQRELVSETIDNSYTSITSLFSEKCTGAPHSNATLYCAAPTTLPNGAYPDDWYKGIVSLQDNLWFIDIGNTSATFLSDFLLESGRAIDVSMIGADREGQYVYFINKNDNTLWLFDRTVALDE